MNNNTVEFTSSGCGFVGLLTITFIVLKLVGVINWSWIWVLAPLWISAALAVGIILIVLIIIAVCAIINRF